MSKLLELADAYAVQCRASAEDCQEIDKARAALVAEIERVERDAARYRWLRKQNLDAMESAIYRIINHMECQLLPAGDTFATLDVAIDAAIDTMKEQTL